MVAGLCRERITLYAIFDFISVLESIESVESDFSLLGSRPCLRKWNGANRMERCERTRRNLMQLRFASYREVSSPSNVLKEKSRLSRLAQFLSTCRLLFEKRTRHFESAAFSPSSLSSFFPSLSLSPFFFSSFASSLPLFSFFFSISIRSSSSDLAHRLVRLVLALLISRQLRLDSLITSSLNHRLKRSSELYRDRIAFLTSTFRLLKLTEE